MSIVTNVENAFKGFANAFENAWKKLFGALPKVEQTVSAIITDAAPVVSGLVQQIDAKAAPQTAQILTNIQKDLAIAEAATSSVGNSATAQQAVTSLQASLPSLLSAAKIENVATVSKIESWATTLGSDLTYVLGLFQGSGTAAGS